MADRADRSKTSDMSWSTVCHGYDSISAAKQSVPPNTTNAANTGLGEMRRSDSKPELDSFIGLALR